MNGRLSALIGLPCILTLGCANIRTVVSAFKQQDAEFQGKSFVVKYAREDKRDSLQAQAYGELIAQELLKKRMVKHSGSTSPEHIVVFDYSIDDGHLETISYPIFIPGETFTSTTFINSTVTTSAGQARVSGVVNTVGVTSGTVGVGTSTGMVYKRQFTLAIYAQSPTGLKKVYELTATSNGGSGTFDEVARPIIKAALSDFPDNAGEPDIVNTTVWRH